MTTEGALAETRRWLLRAAALLAPLSEAGLELTAFAVFLLGAPFYLRRARDVWRERRWPELLTAGGLAAWVLVGLLACAVSGVAPRFSQMNKALMAFALLVGFFEVARAGEEELRRLFGLLLAGSAAAALVGLHQYFIGAFPGEELLLGGRQGWIGQLYIPGTSERAATGTLLNRLKMAEALLFTAAALWAVLFTTRSRRIRFGAAAGLGVTMVVLALTFVKAAILGLGLGIAAAALLSVAPRLRQLVPRFSAALFCVGAAFVVQAARSATIQSAPPEGSFAIRRWIWQRALALFAERPLFGSGIGTYEAAAGHVFGQQKGVWRTSAHNHHLTVLVEGGVFGLAAWLTTCAGVMLGLRRAWQMNDGAPPHARALLHLATVYVVGIGGLSFFHDVLFHPGTAVLTWLSAGVVLGVCGASRAS